MVDTTRRGCRAALMYLRGLSVNRIGRSPIPKRKVPDFPHLAIDRRDGNDRSRY